MWARMRPVPALLAHENQRLTAVGESTPLKQPRLTCILGQRHPGSHGRRTAALFAESKGPPLRPRQQRPPAGNSGCSELPRPPAAVRRRRRARIWARVYGTSGMLGRHSARKGDHTDRPQLRSPAPAPPAQQRHDPEAPLADTCASPAAVPRQPPRGRRRSALPRHACTGVPRSCHTAAAPLNGVPSGRMSIWHGG